MAIAPVPRHHRERGALPERGGDEIMAIMGVALDGEEGLAGLNGAAVDGNPGDGLPQRPHTLRSRRSRDRIDRPQRRHHECPPAASASRTAS